MKDWKKQYDKSIHLFQNGEIDKALVICEKLISENLKNTSALNLKGLLLYIKGDLKSAEATWKINKDFNDDGISKGYLKDIQKDWERQSLYDQALKDIKEMYIKDAEKKLSICSESDFNKINVNNAIAFCFIKRGEYEKAKECIDVVRAIDKNNKVALDNYKVIKEFSEGNRPKINFKLVIIALMICFVGVIAYLFYKPVSQYISKVKTNYIASRSTKKDETKTIDKTNTNQTTTTNNTTTDKNTENNKQEEAKFPVDQVKAAVNDKDYNKLYTIITSFNKDKLGVNDKIAYNSGDQLLINSGVGSFYDAGRSYFSAKDFVKAKIEFEKASKFSKDNYLNPHIIYMLGVTNEKIEDYEKALVYYDQYVNSYYGGDYTAECLYKLATINNNSDKAKAKQYAEKISKDFNKSMYYNSTIKDILNTQ
jgi:tetratricopeptide (TPR) repeat protein